MGGCQYSQGDRSGLRLKSGIFSVRIIYPGGDLELKRSNYEHEDYKHDNYKHDRIFRTLRANLYYHLALAIFFALHILVHYVLTKRYTYRLNTANRKKIPFCK